MENCLTFICFRIFVVIVRYCINDSRMKYKLVASGFPSEEDPASVELRVLCVFGKFYKFRNVAANTARVSLIFFGHVHAKTSLYGALIIQLIIVWSAV